MSIVSYSAGKGAASAPSEAGFTLIELLVVLAVMAVLTVSFTVDFRNAEGGMTIRTAATELAESLRIARSEAIARNVPVALDLNLESGAYAVAAKGLRGTLAPGIALEMTIARSDVKGAANGSIRFYPDGTSNGGRIVLSRGTHRRQISVHWLTGDVTIEN